MKNVWLVICVICLCSCSKDVPKKPVFLVGYWNRTNDAPNHKTYEIWNPDFTGIGFTMRQRDTVFKELLSIVEIDGTLVLKVEGVNEEPTLFTFTELTETSFTCENPNNEFPKKITYYMDETQMKAIVSDHENSIEFVFERSL